MYLNVGEISKALGISAETIRYKEIKKIMLGAPLEEIGSIIDKRRNDLIREIKAKMDALESLTNWRETYTEELDLIGKFMIGSMPSGFRQDLDFEEPDHIARYIEKFFDLEKENWGAFSISFFYDMYHGDGKLQRYLSIDGDQKLRVDNLSGGGVYLQEKADRCIITEVHYHKDIFHMIQPIVDYAAQQGITLEGTFYGRENTNYFEGGIRSGIYKVYAPIKT